MNRRRIVVGASVAALLVGLLAGCGDKHTEPFKDGPRSNVVNTKPADIIEAPDGFSNLATKCDHGNRLYIAYKGDDNRAAVTVVPGDPTCR
jgi:hypothetical protein